MGTPGVRFFTYSVSNDPGITDDPRTFHAILELENFDVNTDLIPDLKTWLESNIKLDPNMSAFDPVFVFSNIPANRTPSGDSKI